MNIVTIIVTIGLIAGFVWFDLAPQRHRRLYQLRFAIVMLIGMSVLMYSAITRSH